MRRGEVSERFNVLWGVFQREAAPLIQRLRENGTRVVSLSSLLRAPLMNGVFKEPDKAGRGTKLVNVFDLYGDTAINLDLVDRLEVSPEDEERFGVEEGDIFFTRSSLKPEGVGWSAYLEEQHEPAVFECHVIRARVDADQCVPGFLSNYARTWLAREYLVARASVTTMATIDQGALEQMPVVLPDRQVQFKLLDRLNAARATRQARILQAEELQEGLDGFMLDAVGLVPLPRPKTVFAVSPRDLVDALNPARYQGAQLEKHLPFKSTVGVAGRLLEARTAPEKEAPEERWDWIRIDDLPNRPWRVETVRTEIGRNIRGTFFEVQENDILVARLGPTILNAKFVLCPKLARRTVASSEFLTIRCSDGWQPEFVLWLLRTTVYREIMYARSRGATPSRFRLDGGDLLTIPFPQMSTDTQTRITAEVRRRRDEARRLREQAEQEWNAEKLAFEHELLGSD